MNQKSFFSLQEVTEELGISYRTTLRLVKKSALPAFKVGHQWRIKSDDLERYIKEGVRYYGLLAVKPLYFHPNVLNRYQKDQSKYYVHNGTFYGRFGIREDWYKKFSTHKSRLNLLFQVHYNKVRIGPDTFLICVDTKEYEKTIAQNLEESNHWQKFMTRSP